MDSNNDKSISQLSTIEFLLFSVGGIRFGADMEQVSKIARKEVAGKRGHKILDFHKIIDFKGRDFTYKAPKAILLKDCSEEIGVVVDSPEGIICRSIREIQPMPSLVAEKMDSKAIWGTTMHNDDIVLLVDLVKLCNN